MFPNAFLLYGQLDSEWSKVSKVGVVINLKTKLKGSIITTPWTLNTRDIICFPDARFGSGNDHKLYQKKLHCSTQYSAAIASNPTPVPDSSSGVGAIELITRRLPNNLDIRGEQA